MNDVHNFGAYKMSLPIEKITKTVGKVTSLNTDHFQFVIDNETVVYAGLWSFKNGNRLPSIGETVIITTVHDHVSNATGCIILCDKSELVCAGAATKGGPYKSVVQSHSLGTADVEFIAKLHLSVEHDIEGTCEISPAVVSIAVVAKLMERAPLREYSCQNNRLRNIHVKTVSLFRLVDKSNDAYVRLQFPYWTFGVHRHGRRAPDLLLGFLTVSAENGVLILKDGKNEVECKIFDDGDAMPLFNKFVLIRRCYAVTEVFSEPGVAPAQVVAFHVRDAVALSWLPIMYADRMRVLLRPTGKQSHILAFNLLHKGNVYLSPDGRPHCCLVVRPANGIVRLLVLAPNLLHVLPLLRPNRKYKLMQNAPSRFYYWNQVQRFMPKGTPTHMVDSSEAIFVDAGASDSPERLLTLREAKEHVRQHDTMFSFTGWLYEKSFCKPHVSFYAEKLPKLEHFGTPGKKTHVLYFTSADLKMSVYLNDFEPHLAPAGLIPGMLLKVRCVIPQKNMYVKSTPLTTFELVDFKPIIPFDSVNLCSESWGLMRKSDSYLGLGVTMPLLTLISGRLHNVHIIKATLTVNCAVCNKSGTCSCESAVKKCVVNMFLKCRDSMGAFCLSTRSVDTFKQLLRLNNFQFDAIVEALHQIGTFQYNADENFKDRSPGPGRFCNTLDCAFQYCSFVLHDVPVVARRFYTKDKKPVYFSFDIL